MPVKPQEGSVNYPGWLATTLFQGAISEILREHMARQNISQHKLSFTLGVNDRTVETNLSEDGDFRVSQLFRMSQVLGFDFADAVADALFEAARSGLIEQRDELLDEAARIGADAQRERNPDKQRRRDHHREYMQRMRKRQAEAEAAAASNENQPAADNEESESA